MIQTHQCNKANKQRTPISKASKNPRESLPNQSLPTFNLGATSKRDTTNSHSKKESKVLVVPKTFTLEKAMVK